MGVQLRLSASSSLHVTSLNDVFESPQEVGTCDVVGSHAATLCANIVETPSYPLISEQGGKDDSLCW